MSLDVYIEESGYSANITHNLNRMADAVSEDFYKAIWRPEELFDNPKAKDIIDIIQCGLVELVLNPGKYKEFNASNGWGKYENFVRFVIEYHEALKESLESPIVVSR